MPIANVQDAHEVERSLQAILSHPGTDERTQAIRALFVETLDFDHENRLVPLSAANDPDLPADARLLARRDGFSILYVPLDGADDDRVKTATASSAAKAVGDAITDEPLLLFTSRDCDQLHFIYPDLSGNRPRLQRLVAHRGQPARTAIQQIANMWHDYGELGKPMGEAVRNAFSVQPVTDAFFKDYKAAYDTAVGQIALGIGQTDAEQFTQTMFNRLLFVHFVSRKGWLRFRGDSDYLNALWTNYQTDGGQSNFYSGRLEALFFAGLNNPQAFDLMRDNPALHALIGDVPFLNGGLFERTELDRHPGLNVPDEAVAPLITGLFNRYNFTVMEATPLDTEVAVDPEMLGKLFENTVNERHSNGAYYTPRPVVAFMCREAIKGYLGGRNIAGLTEASITDLVDNTNPQAITVAQALEIANAVAGMKAVDPACGSGAFLLGMLQEILTLNETLFRAGHSPESLYQQKLDIISNNIYGADKDGLAVSTAMLRLWLSLAVDYDGEGTPDPLPNLDLKLVAGDAIAGPNPQQLDLTLLGIVNSGLREDSVAYTTAQGQRKADLKDKVGATKRELRDNMNDAAPEGVVEWRIDFADVMLNGGFDVVIANPPYVQLQGNGGELGNLYKNCGYATFARTGDLYQLFYERGCQLLRPQQGILAYITSNSWLKAEYGKATRRYFAERHTPLTLLELGKDVFASAIVDSGVLMLQTGGSARPFQAVDMDRVKTADVPPALDLWGQVRPSGDAPWSILSATEQSIMDKMLAVGTPLKDWDIAIYRGITTGLNEAFIIDNQTKEALVAQDPRSEEIIKPVLRGRDIERYRAKWAGMWLINTHNGYEDVPPIEVNDYPAIKTYLDTHYEKLANRYDKGRTPYNLRNCAYHADFSKEKLLWIELVNDGRFAYDNSGFYGEATTFLLTGECIKYLCAVLNTRLIRWFLEKTAPTSGMGTLRWKKVYVERLPIPKIVAPKQKPFGQLVDRILNAGAVDQQSNLTAAETEIDELVYQAYGLTTEEIAVVEDSRSPYSRA